MAENKEKSGDVCVASNVCDSHGIAFTSKNTEFDKMIVPTLKTLAESCIKAFTSDSQDKNEAKPCSIEFHSDDATCTHDEQKVYSDTAKELGEIAQTSQEEGYFLENRLTDFGEQHTVETLVLQKHRDEFSPNELDCRIFKENYVKPGEDKSETVRSMDASDAEDRISGVLSKIDTDDTNDLFKLQQCCKSSKKELQIYVSVQETDKPKDIDYYTTLPTIVSDMEENISGLNCVKVLLEEICDKVHLLLEIQDKIENINVDKKSNALDPKGMYANHQNSETPVGAFANCLKEVEPVSQDEMIECMRVPDMDSSQSSLQDCPAIKTDSQAEDMVIYKTFKDQTSITCSQIINLDQASEIKRSPNLQLQESCVINSDSPVCGEERNIKRKLTREQEQHTVDMDEGSLRKIEKLQYSDSICQLLENQNISHQPETSVNTGIDKEVDKTGGDIYSLDTANIKMVQTEGNTDSDSRTASVSILANESANSSTPARDKDVKIDVHTGYNKTLPGTAMISHIDHKPLVTGRLLKTKELDKSEQKTLAYIDINDHFVEEKPKDKTRFKLPSLSEEKESSTGPACVKMLLGNICDQVDLKLRVQGVTDHVEKYEEQVSVDNRRYELSNYESCLKQDLPISEEQQTSVSQVSQKYSSQGHTRCINAEQLHNELQSAEETNKEIYVEHHNLETMNEPLVSTETSDELDEESSRSKITESQPLVKHENGDDTTMDRIKEELWEEEYTTVSSTKQIPDKDIKETEELKTIEENFEAGSNAKCTDSTKDTFLGEGVDVNQNEHEASAVELSPLSGIHSTESSSHGKTINQGPFAFCLKLPTEEFAGTQIIDCVKVLLQDLCNQVNLNLRIQDIAQESRIQKVAVKSFSEDQYVNYQKHEVSIDETCVKEDIPISQEEVIEFITASQLYHSQTSSQASQECSSPRSVKSSSVDEGGSFLQTSILDEDISRPSFYTDNFVKDEKHLDPDGQTDDIHQELEDEVKYRKRKYSQDQTLIDEDVNLTKKPHLDSPEESQIVSDCATPEKMEETESVPLYSCDADLYDGNGSLFCQTLDQFSQESVHSVYKEQTEAVEVSLDEPGCVPEVSCPDQGEQASFRWKYRPSLQSEEDSSLSHIGSTVANLVTLPALPKSRGVRRSGLSRRQRVKRLHASYRMPES